MSTLSGNATKGEKGKKFQQLKIFLPSGSKSAEPEQQPNKSSAQRIQHGMTSLGKVPTARRPTNLPSEKSEQSGNDPSVNLVPSGGPGWGNKANETGPTAPSTQNANPPTSVSVNSTPIPGTSQPVQHVQHYPPASRMSPMAPVGPVPVHHGHPDAKTWARMTLGGDSSAGNLFTPQSPLFHHEFPSLSSNAEATTASTTHATATVTQKSAANSAADTQYGPGPSLRPQTVSWMSGSRPQGSMVPAVGNLPVSAPAPVRPTFPPHIGPDGARNNLAPSGVGVVPGGPYHPVMSDKIPPQYGALMPPFMLRNSYPGAFPPGVAPRPPYGTYMASGQHGPAERYLQPPNAGANSNKRSYDDEDVKIRSIINEEDLNQMANMSNDIGWAGHEDIDYNQKLKFSDDEDDDKNKEHRVKSRNKTQQSSKPTDKPSAKKESDRENDFKSSMESLKEREKLFPMDNRPSEVRNAWLARKTMVAANTAARYQIAPPAGRFGEDDDDLQERRKQKKDEMDIIIQRAKERREEEEKRYQEQLQQAASLKLKNLDERILAEQRKLENKDSRFSERDIDMLPEWEKEKFRAQNKLNENQNGDESKKIQTATLVPVVKDASEFRALTQLGDRSVFTKKERESASSNYSRPFANNVPPRFQNLNRQNSSGPVSNSTSSQNLEVRKNSISQFSSKSSSPSFGSVRHGRLDSDSQSEKDREWNSEDARKEPIISDDRPSERFQRDSNHNRDYNYERESDDNWRFSKEYSDSKRKFYEKGDYAGDTYKREYDRESNYSMKMERKNSESERSDKSKDYDGRRYSENESHEKTPPTSWRHEESPEKSRQHYTARSPRTFSENENHERKKSRDEGSYEKGNEREREYHRKEAPNRDRKELEREKELDHRDTFADNEVKRSRDGDKKEKDSERKSPATYDDRVSRNEPREGRYSRESRESLRDESYTIKEERSYAWTNDTEVEEKPVLRREHYREERGGDRYSHAQRHPPGPITREKLEAKELEDSKRSLTPLVRSDKKTDAKRSETEERKEKEKSDTGSAETASNSSHSQKQEEPVKSAWNKDDRKDKEIKSSTVSSEGPSDSKENKEKDDAKESAKSASKQEDQTTKSGEDKRGERNKKNERVSKRDTRNNWARHPVYRGNPYVGGRPESKMHRSARGPLGKGSSRRDSKYSESDYSDEISGSGREDRMSRNDRDDRPIKSKRYDRDDRNMDYRMDRDYVGGGRGRNHDYAYSKPSHRGRGGFRGAVGVGKRMDGYGPPPSKSPFGSQGGYREERRSKSSRDSNNLHDHHGASEKRESHSYDKNQPADGKSTVSGSRQHNENDKNWKKNDNVQDNKSTLSSPTSVQTAEANEESFATASEGTDSEDNGQLGKSKASFGGTKRQSTVTTTKPQRRNYRSTSRKRYDSRRSAPLYSRKDPGAYSTGKRNAASGSGGKSSMSNKENEKYSSEMASENNFAKEGDLKAGDKPRREYGDSQAKKGMKSRNRSNSRKNIRTGGVLSNRSKNPELSARSQGKPKKNYDSKSFGDRKESKLDIPVPLFRELGPPIPAPPPTVNAWDKPITGALRTGSPSINAATSVNVSASSVPASAANNSATAVKEKSVVQTAEQHNESSPQSDLSSSVNLSADKVTTKVLENLDGSSPPVQTIIFENTNFKSGPSDLNSKPKYTNQMKNHRYEKDMKLERLNSECGVPNFGVDPSNSELPNNKHDSLQMSLSFNKNEDASDMKLEFNFDSEISKLTEDSKSAKAMELTHAMHLVQSSTAADLNFKIASVKKVWDGSLVEHFDDKYDGGMVNVSSTTFSPSFSCHASDPSNGACYVNAHVETAAHVQVDDVGGLGHNEVVFSPVSQMQGVNSSYGSANCQTVVIKNDSTSSNVCKVKPQPQGCNSTNMPIVAQQSVGMSATLVSQPPPMSSPSYTFSCSTPQPNLSNNTVSATALAQMNYQQYSSMPPVPSPPVIYNSSQTATAPPTGLYQTYQIDNSQVAARSQFGQYPSYGISGALGQTSAFSQQSLFVQPPPNAPPPELYPAAMTGFRLQPQAFGNTQQITSPSTVLISSSSNSLMSATVKPSNQQIGAIGTKTGFTTAQTSQQVFIPFEQASQILPPNFMAGNQLLQRPAGNVLPAASLQASTSFYNTGSGGGQTGFYQPGTNSHLQPQPGTAIGLTTFNAQSATASLGPAAIQNFGSQLTQQFRSAPATSYLKGGGNPCSIPSDFGNGKTITLSNQHDQLFPAGNQMSSAKPRIPAGGKAVQNVQQAMGQHTMSPNSYNYSPANQMRNNGGANKGSQYPHPIQRPVSQGNNSSRSGNANNSSASHRMPVRNNSHQLVNNLQQQPPSSVYYSPSSGYNSTGSSKLEPSQLDSKTESSADSKLADSIKTINSKNASVSSSEKAAAANE